MKYLKCQDCQNNKLIMIETIPLESPHSRRNTGVTGCEYRNLCDGVNYYKIKK